MPDTEMVEPDTVSVTNLDGVDTWNLETRDPGDDLSAAIPVKASVQTLVTAVSQTWMLSTNYF